MCDCKVVHHFNGVMSKQTTNDHKHSVSFHLKFMAVFILKEHKIKYIELNHLKV